MKYERYETSDKVTNTTRNGKNNCERRAQTLNFVEEKLQTKELHCKMQKSGTEL